MTDNHPITVGNKKRTVKDDHNVAQHYYQHSVESEQNRHRGSNGPKSSIAFYHLI